MRVIYNGKRSVRVDLDNKAHAEAFYYWARKVAQERALFDTREMVTTRHTVHNILGSITGIENLKTRLSDCVREIRETTYTDRFSNIRDRKTGEIIARPYTNLEIAWRQAPESNPFKKLGVCWHDEDGNAVPTEVLLERVVDALSDDSELDYLDD